MDWLTFLANLVDSIAWPSVIILLVFLLQDPLRNLIPLIQKLRYKEFEIEFGQQVRELQEEVLGELKDSRIAIEDSSSTEKTLEVLAELSPRSVVLEAWRELEIAAIGAAKRLGGESFRNKSLTFQVIRFLEHQEGVLDATVVSLLRDLRGLRNQAAHAPDFAFSKQSSLDYAASAKAVARYLDNVNRDKA